MALGHRLSQNYAFTECPVPKLPGWFCKMVPRFKTNKYYRLNDTNEGKTILECMSNAVRKLA